MLAMRFIFTLIIATLLAACTDYVQKMDDGFDEWEQVQQQAESDPSYYNSLENTVTDSRDEQVYKTATIGNQIWMAQNLNFETEKSYCYNNNSANCTKYGRLYLWSEAMDSAGTWSSNGKGCGYYNKNSKNCSPTYPVRGICPSGWHLPTQEEWNTLCSTVGGLLVAGKMLKSTSNWYSNGNGSDDYSFSALPAGYRDNSYDSYGGEEANTYFWSSTERDRNNAYNMNLFFKQDLANLNYNNKHLGYSVRCVKDDSPSTKSSSSEVLQSSNSAITSSSVKASSSSKKAVSSSSNNKAFSSSTKSSSSNKVSSSSEQKNKSSSSIKSCSSTPDVPDVIGVVIEDDKGKSSSNSAKAISSSSSKKNEISSSSKKAESSSSEKASWAYLNPTISYGEMTDNRDGQVYKTVKIGEQTWMAENLSYKVTNSHCYKDSAQYCTKYGRYYTWTAAMDSEGIWSPNSKGCGNNQTCSPTYPVRGICAKGWHLPTEEEWQTLLTKSSGKILKSAIGWIGNQNGIDTYGFSAIPAGNKLSGYTRYNWGQSAYFWSSTEFNRINAYYIFFDFDNVNAPQTGYKDDEFSVRCIKD